MEELKLLISMVNDLPELATWVLVGYLIYKISVIGSIYGVIRLLIVKTHDAIVSRNLPFDLVTYPASTIKSLSS